MKTRDSEALEFIVNSGQFMVRFDGTVLTSRDKHGRPTDPPVWRKATHVSTSKQSSPRNRLWVNGKRVYGARAVYVLTKGPIPDGYQVDHKDDNSLNDAPENLQLLDGDGNLQKECAREGTRMRRFQPSDICEVPIGGSLPLDAVVTFSPLPIDTSLPPGTMVQLPRDEVADWRISIAHDIKVGFSNLVARARRWFDRTFLGFR